LIKELIKKAEEKGISKHAGKIILLALGGVLCLYFAFGGGEKSVAEEYTDDFAKDYADTLERKLSEALSRVKGAGECYVTVMLSDGGRDEYAVEEKSAVMGESSSQSETSYPLTKDENGESPLKITRYPPTLSGIAVVCKGGDSLSVKTELTELISSLTGLPSSRIHISPLG